MNPLTEGKTLGNVSSKRYTSSARPTVPPPCPKPSSSFENLRGTRERFRQLKRRLEAEFLTAAKKCEFHRVVKEKDRDYADWDSCTNKEHVYSMSSTVVCDHKFCPKLNK